MFTDPQFRAREAILYLTREVLGPFPVQAVVPRLSQTPGAVRSLGPALRQHTREIYRSLLGISEERLEALREKGIV